MMYEDMLYIYTVYLIILYVYLFISNHNFQLKKTQGKNYENIRHHRVKLEHLFIKSQIFKVPCLI